jgi:large subunit ribosomal protein L36
MIKEGYEDDPTCGLPASCSEQTESASLDLLCRMAKTLANALISAEADPACRAEYGAGNDRECARALPRWSGRAEGSTTMKVRSSVRSLARIPGSVVVRRRGTVRVINKRNPRWSARQG